MVWAPPHANTNRAILLRGFHSNFACGRAHTNDQTLFVWQRGTKEISNHHARPWQLIPDFTENIKNHSFFTETVQTRPNRSLDRGS